MENRSLLASSADIIGVVISHLNKGYALITDVSVREFKLFDFDLIKEGSNNTFVRYKG